MTIYISRYIWHHTSHQPIYALCLVLPQSLLTQDLIVTFAFSVGEIIKCELKLHPFSHSPKHFSLYMFCIHEYWVSHEDRLVIYLIDKMFYQHKWVFVSKIRIHQHDGIVFLFLRISPTKVLNDEAFLFVSLTHLL